MVEDPHSWSGWPDVPHVQHTFSRLQTVIKFSCKGPISNLYILTISHSIPIFTRFFPSFFWFPARSSPAGPSQRLAWRRVASRCTCRILTSRRWRCSKFRETLEGGHPLGLDILEILLDRFGMIWIDWMFFLEDFQDVEFVNG